jgi:osmotically-inducible protein OsmY
MVLLGVVLITPGFLRADGPLDTGRDLLLTYHARVALLQDRELGTLNLGVRVHNRVAVLWGPVPSAELAQRAVNVLKQLPELVAVRNELHIDDFQDAPRFLPQTLPEARRPSSPAVLTTQSRGEEPVRQPERPAWQPLTQGMKDPRMPDQTEIEIVLPSLRVPLPVLDPVRSDKTLEETILAAHSQPRFQAVRVEVKGAVVYLAAEADHAGVLYELAQVLSHLPGVERVVVQER